MKSKFYLQFIAILIISILPSMGFANQLNYPKDNPTFTVPEGLRPNVNFWIDIYSKYSTDNIVIHDDVNLDIVYDVITLSTEFAGMNLSERMKRRKINKIRKNYVKTVKKFKRYGIDESKLTPKEKDIYTMLKSHYSSKEIKNAYRRIRTQLGQSDKFLEGMIRSGLYIDKIKAIFKSFNLPAELTVLPHVESSFNYKAYSRYGAAGIWQFTRSTGRNYMHINYEIDDRRDPIISAVAAAKLLKHNFSKIGSWPLAITAYNHGLHGMKRAKRKVGDDIVTIIKKYKSRLFGFASRNFYSEFLAALHVVRNYEQYFGNVTISKPLKYDIFKIKDYIDITALSVYFDTSVKDIHALNPSLRQSILEANKHVPKGFNLKIPDGKLKTYEKMYALIPQERKFNQQKRSKWYKIKRGDTLGKIASVFRTSVRKLKILNHIGNSHRIYPGEIIQLPQQRSYKRYASVKKEKINPGKYVVERGDSLSHIAKRANIDLDTLKTANNLLNIDKLDKGQVLIIPDSNITVKNTPAPVFIKLAKNIIPEVPESNQKEAALPSPAPPIATAAKTSSTEQIAADKIIEKFMVKALPAAGVSNISEEDGQTMGWIEVGTDETIGHFSDWGKVPTWKLRRLNKLRHGQAIKIGQKIKIPFNKVSHEAFEMKRKEYLKSIQEDFFASFKVEKTIDYVLKKGDTIWDICKNNELPYWLLKGFNNDKDLMTSLIAGDTLQMPVLSVIN